MSPPDTEDDEEHSEQTNPISKRMGVRRPLMELIMMGQEQVNAPLNPVTPTQNSPILYEQEANHKSQSLNEGNFLGIQY